MRQIAIVAATALVTAGIVIWGGTVINANSPRQATAAPAAPSIDVMQIMKDARNLPDQQFDAY